MRAQEKHGVSVRGERGSVAKAAGKLFWYQLKWDIKKSNGHWGNAQYNLPLEGRGASSTRGKRKNGLGQKACRTGKEGIQRGVRKKGRGKTSDFGKQN